jgi:hypothetical protein
MKKTTLLAALILAVVPPFFGQTVDWSKKTLQSERSRSYDALHYLIRINLDLDQKTFLGAATVTVASFREGLTACVLDAEEFTVTSVISDDGVPLKFEPTSKELTVHLPRSYKFGEELSFTCFYHGRDPDSQVRAAALVALGDLKDRTLFDFYKGLFKNDVSYRVQAEALAAIGKTGDPSAVPFLRQAAAVPSYRDMVRRAAETALRQLENR